MVFLAGLVPASCHKNASAQKPNPQAPVVVGTKSMAATFTNSAVPTASNAPVAVTFTGDLGKINLTNRTDTCLLFADGQSCTMTPKMIDRNNVRITIALESKNDYGETHNFSVCQVTGTPDKPMEVAVGDLNLSFVPHIVSDN